MDMTRKVQAFLTESGRTAAEAGIRLMDIASELGELEKEYLKATDYGAKAFAPDAGFTEEYGDVLFALLALGAETGVDAEAALDAVLEKYRRRMREKGAMGSGR